MTVQLVGTDQALADMARWAGQVKTEVDKATQPLGARVAGIVSGKVPHLTGQLAGSVGSDTDDEGVSVSMGDGLPYAGWIEFGGSRGRDYIAQGRYLYPTLVDFADEFQTIAANSAADSVGGFAWSTPA